MHTHKLHDTPSRLLTQCSRESKLHLKNARTHIVAIHKTTNPCATISSYKFKTVLIALQQCFNILKTRHSEFISCKMGPRPYKPYLKLLIGDCTTPGEKKTCQAKGEGRVAAPLQWNMSVRPCKPWVYIQNWCWCWCCSCCCCCCQNILHSLKSLKSWHDDDMWTMLMLLIIYTQVGHEQKCSPGAAWNPNSQNQVQNSRPISEASEWASRPRNSSAQSAILHLPIFCISVCIGYCTEPIKISPWWVVWADQGNVG